MIEPHLKWFAATSNNWHILSGSERGSKMKNNTSCSVTISCICHLLQKKQVTLINFGFKLFQWMFLKSISSFYESGTAQQKQQQQPMCFWRTPVNSAAVTINLQRYTTPKLEPELELQPAAGTRIALLIRISPRLCSLRMAATGTCC